MEQQGSSAHGNLHSDSDTQQRQQQPPQMEQQNVQPLQQQQPQQQQQQQTRRRRRKQELKQDQQEIEQLQLELQEQPPQTQQLQTQQQQQQLQAQQRRQIQRQRQLEQRQREQERKRREQEQWYTLKQPLEERIQERMAREALQPPPPFGSVSRPPNVPVSWASPQDLWRAMKSKEDTYQRSFSIFSHNKNTYTPRHRAVLVEWLIEVCETFNLRRETFHLSVEYLDRFYSTNPQVILAQVQMSGITALMIAAKVEEINPPKGPRMAHVCDGACTWEDLRAFEIHMLQSLSWKVSPPTINTWLQLYLQISALRRHPLHHLHKAPSSNDADAVPRHSDPPHQHHLDSTPRHSEASHHHSGSSPHPPDSVPHHIPNQDHPAFITHQVQQPLHSSSPHQTLHQLSSVQQHFPNQDCHDVVVDHHYIPHSMDSIPQPVPHQVPYHPDSAPHQIPTPHQIQQHPVLQPLMPPVAPPGQRSSPAFLVPTGTSSHHLYGSVPHRGTLSTGVSYNNVVPLHESAHYAVPSDTLRNVPGGLGANPQQLPQGILRPIPLRVLSRCVSAPENLNILMKAVDVVQSSDFAQHLSLDVARQHSSYVASDVAQQCPSFVASDVAQQHPSFVASDVAQRHPSFVALDVAQQHRSYMASDVAQQHPSSMASDVAQQHPSSMASDVAQQHLSYMASDVAQQHPSSVASDVAQWHPSSVASDVAQWHPSYVASDVAQQHPSFVASDVAQQHPHFVASDVAQQHPSHMASPSLSDASHLLSSMATLQTGPSQSLSVTGPQQLKDVGYRQSLNVRHGPLDAGPHHSSSDVQLPHSSSMNFGSLDHSFEGQNQMFEASHYEPSIVIHHRPSLHTDHHHHHHHHYSSHLGSEGRRGELSLLQSELGVEFNDSGHCEGVDNDSYDNYDVDQDKENTTARGGFDVGYTQHSSLGGTAQRGQNTTQGLADVMTEVDKCQLAGRSERSQLMPYGFEIDEASDFIMNSSSSAKKGEKRRRELSIAENEHSRMSEGMNDSNAQEDCLPPPDDAGDKSMMEDTGIESDWAVSLYCSEDDEEVTANTEVKETANPESRETINPERKEEEDDDSEESLDILTAHYSVEDYVKASQLLDLVVLDANSLRFPHSVLAAAAFYHSTKHGTTDITTISGWEVEECLQWMHIHKLVILSSPQRYVWGVTPQPHCHLTQTSFITEDMPAKAMNLSNQFFKSYVDRKQVNQHVIRQLEELWEHPPP